ncbi:MAG: radical SAM family heme chaperone HemW [Dehalococcoidia bacterium]|nr:radical SAM family heme chaperone HemW [Dehalococcoidia bacterium]
MIASSTAPGFLVSEGSDSSPLSLYLHIPFCDWKCTYCDFNSYAGMDDLIPAFVTALAREIRLWGDVLGRRSVQTVFFGGGTPSLLSTPDLDTLMTAVRCSFALEEGAEVTLEGNPGTVDRGKLTGFRSCGINRVSFGVQSFDPLELKFLTRIHDADAARKAYTDARDAGFENVNLDFIFGLPGQTEASWRRTLDEAIALQPEHLSLYILTVEESTPLGQQVAKGAVGEANPDTVAALYEWTCERMGKGGYAQYEISNWSLDGRTCRHNLVYWENRDYLGVGPGAHSHLGATRFAVIRSPRAYVRQMTADEAARVPFSIHDSVEHQDSAAEMTDSAWLGLRLNRGLDLAGFKVRFGESFDSAFPGVAARYEGQGLLERDGDRLRLTARGRLMSNEVFADLVAVSDAVQTA